MTMTTVKKCMYCGTNYNILPCILYTPLFGPQRVPASEEYALGHHVKTGYRLAFKWWRFHIGIERHRS